MGKFPVRTQPLLVGAKVKAEGSPSQTGLQCPLAHMYIRPNGRPGWASPQHPLAGMRTMTVQMRQSWAIIPASSHKRQDWGLAKLGYAAAPTSLSWDWGAGQKELD